MSISDTPAGRVIAELIGQAQTDPELKAAYLRAILVAAPGNSRGGPGQGQATRTTARDLDPETVVDQLWGACYHRLLLPDQPLTDEFIDALIDNSLVESLRK